MWITTGIIIIYLMGIPVTFILEPYLYCPDPETKDNLKDVVLLSLFWPIFLLIVLPVSTLIVLREATRQRVLRKKQEKNQKTSQKKDSESSVPKREPINYRVAPCHICGHAVQYLDEIEKELTSVEHYNPLKNHS